jgi:hypothetical protein
VDSGLGSIRCWRSSRFSEDTKRMRTQNTRSSKWVQVKTITSDFSVSTVVRGNS